MEGERLQDENHTILNPNESVLLDEGKRLCYHFEIRKYEQLGYQVCRIRNTNSFYHQHQHMIL